MWSIRTSSMQQIPFLKPSIWFPIALEHECIINNDTGSVKKIDWWNSFTKATSSFRIQTSYPLNTMDVATSGLRLKDVQKPPQCVYIYTLTQRIRDNTDIFLYFILTSNLWQACVQMPTPGNAGKNPKLHGCVACLY